VGYAAGSDGLSFFEQPNHHHGDSRRQDPPAVDGVKGVPGAGFIEQSGPELFWFQLTFGLKATQPAGPR
jgi:hypothetical protein